MPAPRETEPNRLPPPSPELVLLGVMVQAHLRMLSPKKRIAFLREVAAEMRLMEENLDVVNFRPRSDREALRRARVEALEFWRQSLGVFVSRLDG